MKELDRATPEERIGAGTSVYSNVTHRVLTILSISNRGIITTEDGHIPSDIFLRRLNNNYYRFLNGIEKAQVIQKKTKKGGMINKEVKFGT